MFTRKNTILTKMKYLPLILLLLFACKKDSKENPQPQATVTPPPPQNQTKTCYSDFLIDTVYYTGTNQIANIRRMYTWKLCQIYGYLNVINPMCVEISPNYQAVQNMLRPYQITFEQIGMWSPHDSSHFKLTTTAPWDSVKFQYRYYNGSFYEFKSAMRYFQ